MIIINQLQKDPILILYNNSDPILIAHAQSALQRIEPFSIVRGCELIRVNM